MVGLNFFRINTLSYLRLARLGNRKKYFYFIFILRKGIEKKMAAYQNGRRVYDAPGKKIN